MEEKKLTKKKKKTSSKPSLKLFSDDIHHYKEGCKQILNTES